MNCYEIIRGIVLDAIGTVFTIAPDAIPVFALEPARTPKHGDMACNAALVLGKILGRAPPSIADDLIRYLQTHDAIAHAEKAGPGFINLRLTDSFWQSVIASILNADDDWGRSDIGRNTPINVEYVSANPTGPMHIGHARGAVVGDVIAALLERIGHPVTREYYVNDAGVQIDALTQSVWIRYLQCCGETIADPGEGLYPGTYLIDVAKEIFRRDGKEWQKKGRKAAYETIKKDALDRMMEMIRTDLHRLGVHHDVFTSEQALIKENKVELAIDRLRQKDLIDNAIPPGPKGDKGKAGTKPLPMFRSSLFGDDQDRPLRKADGNATYFASDAAYHYDKYRRGFTKMMNIWGRDHGGYVKRVEAALTALSDAKAHLDVTMVALVNVCADGSKVKMSKRAGNLVLLSEALHHLSAGVIRFTMLTRRSDIPLDFDLAKAKDESRNNPFFYVQYAHARCHSVMRSAPNPSPDPSPDPSGDGADLSLLKHPREKELIKCLAFWPQCVREAALTREPHRVVYYLEDVASRFHALWSAGNRQAALRFLQSDKPQETKARLALIRASATTLACGLRVLGIEPLQELRNNHEASLPPL